ncbi:MCP methyltransferase, CheR-type [Halothece sp. PCC 7418]|uniref:CheR family methyltransferase n=1 Tax=Halothece sp. (strain PCC 7418) TaxID=65093 RepID=UPI0002A0674D|nr:CheR family methyltransferase [Halothece sp. PCC 7418]AFZ43211.1 MCP methyltransferase, CheR-type [Halothece sp. PCC 7418]
MKDKIDSDLNRKFIRLIEQKTGLRIREQSQDDLQSAILTRRKALKLQSPQAYYQLLAAPTSDSASEWQKLIPSLTNLESHFFRDQGQFQLLRDKIFPELIQRNRGHKTLRICSAGCSTGEEPYSLAITLRELIRDWENWDITILGVDINPMALEKAKAGVYGQWSFRRVEPYIQRHYFQTSGDKFHLSPLIRDLVRFRQVNLYRDSFPTETSPLQAMDLIVCRNVFIYFDPKVVAQILNKFYQVLKPEGYLLTGHAELSGLDLSQFKAQVFPESLIYQRPMQSSSAAVTAKIIPQPVYTPAFTPTPIPPPQQPPQPVAKKVSSPLSKPKTAKKQDVKTLLIAAETAYGQKNYDEAIHQLQTLLKDDSRNFSAHHLLAQIYANVGQYAEAKQCCQEALTIQEFAIAPYYILAKIAEEEDDLEQAKQLYKRIIYLDQNSFTAYLELSHIYHLQGDQTRREKMKASAIKLLQRSPKEQKIPELNNITVAEVLEEMAI